MRPISTVPLALALAAPARSQCPEATLPKSPGTDTSRGHTLAIEGEWAAVGLHMSQGPASKSSVAIYRRSPAGEWDLDAKPKYAGNFGAALAWNDGRLLVSSPGPWSSDPSGWIRELARDDGTGEWIKTQGIYPSQPEAVFGYDLATDGDLLAVLALTEIQGPQLYHVYVYERDASGIWLETGRISSTDLGYQDIWDLEVEDGRIAVSDANFAGVGEVAILEATGGGWSATARLSPSTFGYGGLGKTLRFEGDYLVATAYSALLEPGAEVFARDAAGSWSSVALLASFPEEVESIALADDMLLLGYPDATGGGMSQAGLVARYRLVGGVWTADGTIEAAVPVRGAQFGHDVETDGAFAFVSEDRSQEMDAVRAIDVQDVDGDGVADRCESVGRVYCSPAAANSTGRAGRILAVGSLTLGDEDLQLVADDLPVGAPTIFLAGGFAGDRPLSDGKLCLKSGKSLGRFAGQMQTADIGGAAFIQVDVNAIPSGNGPFALRPGDTWRFQAWYVDGSSFNFTDAVEVLFR